MSRPPPKSGPRPRVSCLAEAYSRAQPAPGLPLRAPRYHCGTVVPLEFKRSLFSKSHGRRLNGLRWNYGPCGFGPMSKDELESTMLRMPTSVSHFTRLVVFWGV